MLRGLTRHAEQRLARLLFMTQDRVDCGILRITHDFLSTMLDRVRRAVDTTDAGGPGRT